MTCQWRWKSMKFTMNRKPFDPKSRHSPHIFPYNVKMRFPVTVIFIEVTVNEEERNYNEVNKKQTVIEEEGWWWWSLIQMTGSSNLKLLQSMDLKLLQEREEMSHLLSWVPFLLLFLETKMLLIRQCFLDFFSHEMKGCFSMLLGNQRDKTRRTHMKDTQD